MKVSREMEHIPPTLPCKKAGGLGTSSQSAVQGIELRQRERIGKRIMALRLGVDLGGTKIEIAVFESDGREVLRRRSPTPRAGYDAALEEFSGLILDAERAAGAACNVGVG